MRLALSQLVETDPEHAGDQLELDVEPAVLVRTPVGRYRFAPFVGELPIGAQTARCAIINAGDGQHEHPTQALLDAATIRATRILLTQ
jgi:hypothetical protein